MPQIIHIQVAAPAKPPESQPCNGCGVCCLSEPCPLGRVLSRRSVGACVALRWDEPGAQYRCGALTAPQEVVLGRWPGLNPGAGSARAALHRLLVYVLRHLGPRWIAAGAGCDCSLEVQNSSTIGP